MDANCRAKKKNSVSSTSSGGSDDVESSSTTEKQSSGLFGSVGFWGIRDQLLSGLSSKLEAAIHAGLDSFTDSSQQDMTPGKLTKSNTSSSFPRKAKDRSVFGQPEIDSWNQSLHHRNNIEKSSDSLDTIDSGQSMGCSSFTSTSELRSLEKYDPLKFYRTDESVGIGSGQSTSLESSDAEAEESGNDYYRRSDSQLSIKSWASSLSGDSQAEELNRNTKNFVKSFVGKIFSQSGSITQEEKSKFGDVCRTEVGRLWFARYINDQRCQSKKVNESTFYSLAQFFAIVLFECAESDDFIPAKTIMNMCFTYYHELSGHGQSSHHSRQYLYSVLREQPIWRTLRFWNAAFFDAIQCERMNRPTPTRTQMYKYSNDDMRDEAKFQENITFGQLGAFTHNMHSFGLSKEFCLEFLRKQCVIASLQPEQIALLRENIDRMYVQSSKSIN